MEIASSQHRNMKKMKSSVISKRRKKNVFSFKNFMQLMTYSSLIFYWQKEKEEVEKDIFNKCGCWAIIFRTEVILISEIQNIWEM